jgi:hypothetical protein
VSTGASTQDEDRDPLVALVELERAADLVAVHARQHQVQHHEVGDELAGSREPLLTVAGGDHFISLGLEAELEDGEQVHLVVHDEDALSSVGHPVSP